jgi:hypothetical protein
MTSPASPDPFAQPAPTAGQPHYAAPPAQPGGMSRATARGIEYGIVALCLLALACIFQPFSLTLYGVGAGLVVLGGLSFNLIPMCRPGAPLKGVVRAGLIVLTILAVVFTIALATSFAYVWYLQAGR